jgi:hypothetical protein
MLCGCECNSVPTRPRAEAEAELLARKTKPAAPCLQRKAAGSKDPKGGFQMEPHYNGNGGTVNGAEVKGKPPISDHALDCIVLVVEVRS